MTSEPDDWDDDPLTWDEMAATSTGMPALTAAGAVAAVVANGGALTAVEHARRRGEDTADAGTVSGPVVMLLALAIYTAAKSGWPSTRGMDRFNVLRRSDLIETAYALLNAPDVARVIAQQRPPAEGYEHHQLADMATRPEDEVGTVPPQLAADLDRLLAEPDLFDRARRHAVDLLETWLTHPALDTTAGTIWDRIRRWHIRPNWIDALDRGLYLADDEPLNY